MMTAILRDAALYPLIVSCLAFFVSCRTPESPTMAPGPANDAANPEFGTSPVEETLEASDVEVRIEDFKFVPEHLTIKPGTKVIWINKDDDAHTATSTEKPKRFDSGVIKSQESFSFTFKDSGAFPYFCKLHPKMRGVIEVR